MAEKTQAIRVDSEISMMIQKPTNSDADSIEIQDLADGDQHDTVAEHGDDGGCNITEEELSKRLSEIQQWKAELSAEESKLLSHHASAGNTPQNLQNTSAASNSSYLTDSNVPPVSSMPSTTTAVSAPLVVSTPRSLLNFVSHVNTPPVNTISVIDTNAAAVNNMYTTNNQNNQNNQRNSSHDQCVMSNPKLHRVHPKEVPLVKQTPFLPVATMQPPSRKEHKVRPYNGKSSWRTFKFSFDTIADVNGWDDPRRAVELLTCLEGDAQKVYDIIEPARKLDYHYVSSCLNDLFNPNHQEEKYRNQLRKRLKNKGESVNSLGYDILRLANLGYPHLPEESRDQFALDSFKH
ncbi:unnamed protein product, partial [Owenia fusiformis]